jgi:hypothetical protein
MTDDLEDFTQWRGSVEERLGTLESKVETEAHLRATMDSDMGKLHAEFRAQRSILQALHDTQQDHTARLTKVEDRLVRVEGRLVRVEDRLGNVEGTLQLVRVGIEALTGKIDTLIERD